MAHQVTNQAYDFEEPCPECGKYIPVKVDKEDPRFYLECPHCGHKLLFCSCCWDEIDRGLCDWSREHGCHMEREQVDWHHHWVDDCD